MEHSMANKFSESRSHLGLAMVSQVKQESYSPRTMSELDRHA